MKSRSLRLEVIVDSADGAVAAELGGADRVELCDSILEGGTTPSLGMLRATLAAIDIDVSVMIRPRVGDFVYSTLEVDAMRMDIEAARGAGAQSIVLGMLRPDGAVDESRVADLIDTARPMSVTFHRAFDMARDPFDALEALIRLGIDRVLTSGHAAQASEGLPLLRSLVERAGDRIVVMPGCGIRADNITQVKTQTGAREFHASAWLPQPSTMIHRNERVAMGQGQRSPEYECNQTSIEKVRAMAAALRGG